MQADCNSLLVWISDKFKRCKSVMNVAWMAVSNPSTRFNPNSKTNKSKSFVKARLAKVLSKKLV